MKLKLIASCVFLSVIRVVFCQDIIDKCLKSVNIYKNIYKNESEQSRNVIDPYEFFISQDVHSEHALLIVWNGERWLIDSVDTERWFCFVNAWKGNRNVKAYFVGVASQNSWEYLPINPYFIGLRLDKSLEKGKEVSLTFTYSGVQLTDSIFRYLYLNNPFHFFAPTIYVNTEPKLLNGNKIAAKKIGTLKAVNGEKWVTETLTFIVTDSLVGNNWVLITPHNKNSVGFITTCNEYSYTEKQIKPKAAISINNFEVNSYKLTAFQKAKIDTLIQQIIKNKEGNIQIDGFCDSSGNDKYNLWLSNQRALEVKHYLQKKGIKNKISYSGQGSLLGTTDQERVANRKVIISISPHSVRSLK